MSTSPAVTFGVFTPQQQVAYPELLRVWEAVDAVPAIADAWVFDHLLPIGGDPDGPVLEGWTLLAALAARTRRVRLGVLVTSNRFRPPAHLAKIAATVDVVSDGRLELGIGVGSRPNPPEAHREYPAHGLPFDDFRPAVAALDEACTVIRRLWTEPAPFDFAGEHVRLIGAFGNPKPVQQPGPPFTIGGRTTATLRVVARHADRWGFQGADFADGAARGAVLDRLCSEIGRDPGEISRSCVVRLAVDDLDQTSRTIEAAVGAGFDHVALALAAPYPEDAVERIADTIVPRFAETRPGSSLRG